MFKGADALGLMQSRAGVTAASLVNLKEALALVMSEDANADPSPGDDQVTAYDCQRICPAPPVTLVHRMVIDVSASLLKHACLLKPACFVRRYGRVSSKLPASDPAGMF